MNHKLTIRCPVAGGHQNNAPIEHLGEQMLQDHRIANVGHLKLVQA